jgi:kynureninase
MTAYLNCLLKASKYYVPLDKVDDFEASVGESYKDPSAKQFKPGFTILTPEKADERGSQLSVLLLPRNIGMLKHTNKNLEDAGVYGDEREPDVIRFSPIPLYNTYKECFMTARTLDWALKVSQTGRVFVGCSRY